MDQRKTRFVSVFLFPLLGSDIVASVSAVAVAVVNTTFSHFLVVIVLLVVIVAVVSIDPRE